MIADEIKSDMFEKEFRFPAPGGTPLTDKQVQEDPYARYLSAAAQKQMFVSFYRGYEGIMNIVGKVLARDTNWHDVSLASLTQDIRKCIWDDPRSGRWAPFNYETFYFNHGGNVSYAVDCVVDCAATRISNQDGDSSSINMPGCSNDTNFDLVRKKFGLFGYLS